MLVCMKTTLNLPDALFEALKRAAATEKRTVTSIVEEALRQRLSSAQRYAGKPLQLPTWNGESADGYLVEIADREALWATMDESA